ncbi:MAG: SDR family NAD(P)-dependent oxidoreductase, partial [Dehalococcoidia bacterium]
LNGKVAIVTGSSRGIGKAIALGYAKEGAKVVVMARTERPEQSRLPGTIHQTAEEIQALGGECIAIRCDLTKDEDIGNLVDQVVEHYGRIDILVNNAAIILHTDVVDTTVKRWDLLVKINLRAPVILCQKTLPHMIKQGSGSIINLISRSGTDPEGGTTLYGAADAGLQRFSQGLALEVKKHKISVNALDPGRVKTEGALFTYPPDTDWTGWKEPSEVAPSAIFLANEANAGFTGRAVVADEFGKAWP